MSKLMSLLGIFVFIGLAWLISNNRKKVNWRFVASALTLQIVAAILVLGVPFLGFHGPLGFLFDGANDLFLKLIQFTDKGSSFLFGSLLDTEAHGLLIAFQILPIIVFMSSLMSVLYYLGIMRAVVYLFAILMEKTLKVSGAESLGAAANIFAGQTEAPLLIKPFIKGMTHSELFALMVGGMATIAGSVLAAYVGFLKDLLPNIGSHLITASVLSAPAALMVAKVILPETTTPETMGKVPQQDKEDQAVNVIEAAANGASEGLFMAINVGAMLLAFIALISMVDSGLIALGSLIDFSSWAPTIDGNSSQLSLAWFMSWFFSPISFLMGVPMEDLGTVSVLLGKKIVFNEFVAYMDLANIGEQLQPQSLIICSYALCGFANFSSIAIQIGGIGSLVPERKKELAALGLRSVIGGSLAAFITACLANILT